MTNEEKAKELGIKYQIPCHGVGDCEFEAYQSALEMAKWKEQQMIEKACEWLKEIENGTTIIDINLFIKAFIKAMEE